MRRAALLLLVVVAACGGDDQGATTTTAPAATPPRACLEAVDGFPDNGVALIERCDHLRDVVVAVAAGGQELTPGEAATAVRELCVRAGGEDGWRDVEPICAEASEVFG